MGAPNDKSNRPRPELTADAGFKSRFIQLCVRWYITYRLSYRDLVAMMAERGVDVSHTTILRWVLRYVPEFEERWARYARRVNPRGKSMRPRFLCGADGTTCIASVDKHGKTVDFLNFARIAAGTPRRPSSIKAVVTHLPRWPRKVTLDGNGGSHRALRQLRAEDPRWQSVVVRSRRYLNNIVEQDHRAINVAALRCWASSHSELRPSRWLALSLRIAFANGSSRSDAGQRRAWSLKQLWDRALPMTRLRNRSKAGSLPS